MCQSDWSSKMQGGYSKRYGQAITQVVPRYGGNHPRTADIYANDFRHDAGGGPDGKHHATVFHQLRPLTFVLKITGLLPLYEPVSTYEVAPPSQGSAYYTLAVRLAMHASNIFYLYNLFAPGANRIFYSYSGDTVNVNQYIEILLCVLTYSATLLISTKNAAQLLAILNEILRVNEDVYQKFAVTLPDNCSFVWKFMVGIVATQGYLLALNVWQLDIPFDWRCAVLLGFYAVQNCLSGFFIVYTSALLRFITQRFLYVNGLLTGYTYGQQRKAQQPRRFVIRRVRETAVAAPMDTFRDESLFAYRLHNKLLRIYKSINDACSLILVAYMGYAFYSITTNTYNLFVLITTGGWSVSVLQWGLLWLVLHISLLGLLSRNCGEATQQANVTSQILARVYGKNKEFQNIIDKFLTKSIKQEVEFTAYGFFVIDNSTLFKIFSAVTTYLVILIQFRQLEDSKMEDQTPTNN